MLRASQIGSAHVGMCCVTSYWLSNGYQAAAERCGGCQHGRQLSMQAHRVSTGCAVLMQTGSDPSLGITRCQLCHLPYSRDSRLDLSRLNPRRASFRIWTLALLLRFSACVSFIFSSRSRSHSAARNFPPFAFTFRSRTRSSASFFEIRVYTRR